MSYTRTSSTKVTFESRRSWHLSTLTPDAGSAVDTLTPVTVSETTNGTKTHEWRRKIRAHQNAASSFSADKTSHFGGFGQEAATFTDIRAPNGYNEPIGQWESETGCLIKVAIPNFPTHRASIQDEARAKLYKDAANAMTAFRSLTAFGEMRETLRMIRNPLKALRSDMSRHIGRVLKRTRGVKRPSDRRRIIGETYLESTYGWQPFSRDIQSAHSALERRLERYAGSFTRVSGTAFEELQWYTTNHSNSGRVLKRLWDTSTVSRKSYRYYGEVRSVNPNPILADARLIGVTWADLFLTGWELVPWSFVGDYFSNIGDVLESWSIRDCDFAWLVGVARSKVRTVSVNHRTSDSGITGWAGYVPSYGHTHSFSCSPAKATRKSIARATPLTGPAELSFKLEIPGVSSRKWLNLAALGSELSRGKKNLSRRGF